MSIDSQVTDADLGMSLFGLYNQGFTYLWLVDAVMTIYFSIEFIFLDIVDIMNQQATLTN